MEAPAGHRTLRIGVEVKHEEAPLDITVVEQIATKLADLPVDRSVLVSTSGFSADARRLGAARGMELVRVEEVPGIDWASTSSVAVSRREFSFQSIELAYDPGDRSPSIEELAVAQVTGFTDGPKKLGLRNYLAMKAGRVIPADHPAWSEQAFSLKLTLEVSEDVRGKLRLRSGRKSWRLPSFFHLSATGRVRTDHVPLRAFELEGRAAALTALLPGRDGAVQVTLVPEEGGLRLVAGPEKPPRKKLD